MSSATLAKLLFVMSNLNADRTGRNSHMVRRVALDDLRMAQDVVSGQGFLWMGA